MTLCRLASRGDRYRIRCAESPDGLNWTRIGEQEVARHRLADGDVVRVGSTDLAFHQP